MRFKRVVTLDAPALVLGATAAHAAGASPMAGTFTTVETWLTGDIAEFLGICAIVGLGAMIWLAHEYGHMFMYIFRGIVAVALVVFAITVYTTAFGTAATIGAHPSSWIARLVP